MRRGDDPAEDLECLCQIMRTCGRILDTEKGKNLMEQYFCRMRSLAENMDLQPRIRYSKKFNATLSALTCNCGILTLFSELLFLG